MADTLDYTALYKDLYLPKTKPMLIAVPPIRFIMVDGKGAPESDAYQEAMSILYTLTFTIKMSKMSGEEPPGYVEYKVPPLEGLWETGVVGSHSPREGWAWTSMIRQPDFVGEDVFRWALERAAKKDPTLPLHKARLEVWEEGLCVQVMHRGPFATEAESVQKLEEYIQQNGLEADFATRRHHELYLNNPKRTKPENLRTVLRHPVKRR